MPPALRALFLSLLLPAASALSASPPPPSPPPPPYPKTVLVAGATGRTGRLVVSRLLAEPGVRKVRALVRDKAKAEELLDMANGKLEVVTCDLGSKSKVVKACEGVDSAVWCATGFSDAASPINRLKGLFGVAVSPKRSIDILGLSAIVSTLFDAPVSSSSGAPRVVMLSSAGVTRPSWDEAKQMRLAGAADIPIVRLNPFGILDQKV